MTHLSLRPWIRALAVVLCASLLPACMDVDEQMTLQADGSGVMTMRVKIWTAEAAQVEEMVGMIQESGMLGDIDLSKMLPKASELEDVNKIAERLAKQDGIEVLEKRALDDEAKGIRGGEVKLKFKSLVHLAKANAVPMGSLQLKENADRTWTLSGKRLPQNIPEQYMQMAPGLMASAAEQLKNFRLHTVWTLPTRITKTSGKLIKGTKEVTTEGGVVTKTKHTEWLATFSTLTMSEAKFSALDRSVTFEGEGLTLKPFSLGRKLPAGAGAGSTTEEAPAEPKQEAEAKPGAQPERKPQAEPAPGEAPKSEPAPSGAGQ